MGPFQQTPKWGARDIRYSGLGVRSVGPVGEFLENLNSKYISLTKSRPIPGPTVAKVGFQKFSSRSHQGHGSAHVGHSTDLGSHYGGPDRMGGGCIIHIIYRVVKNLGPWGDL